MEEVRLMGPDSNFGTTYKRIRNTINTWYYPNNGAWCKTPEVNVATGLADSLASLPSHELEFLHNSLQTEALKFWLQKIMCFGGSGICFTFLFTSWFVQIFDADPPQNLALYGTLVGLPLGMAMLTLGMSKPRNREKIANDMLRDVNEVRNAPTRNQQMAVRPL